MWPPAANPWPLNGTTNPCRDAAVHTIGLPSMWRNIPATRSHTHQLAGRNHYEMVPLWKKKIGGGGADRRKNDLTLRRWFSPFEWCWFFFLAGTTCSSSGLQLKRWLAGVNSGGGEQRGVVNLYLLFFTARVSCVTAGGHMLLKVHGNKRARLRR